MKWLGIIAAVAAGLVVVYPVIYPTTTYRFRITLNVDTPQGLKSGSSVMEVRTRRYPAWTTLGNNTGQSVLQGEAVLVDLGPGMDGRPRYVIGLLALGQRGEDPNFYLLPGKAFEPLWTQNGVTQAVHGTSWELPKLPPGTRAELHGDLIPTLVTFTDLNDANTARVIRPGNFSQTFGDGVLFRSAAIEIVPAGTWPLTLLGISGEPVTHAAEAKIPEIVRQLRERARVMQVRKVGDPYVAGLGHFVRS